MTASWAPPAGLCWIETIVEPERIMTPFARCLRSIQCMLASMLSDCKQKLQQHDRKSSLRCHSSPLRSLTTAKDDCFTVLVSQLCRLATSKMCTSLQYIIIAGCSGAASHRFCSELQDDQSRSDKHRLLRHLQARHTDASASSDGCGCPCTPAETSSCTQPGQLCAPRWFGRACHQQYAQVSSSFACCHRIWTCSSICNSPGFELAVLPNRRQQPCRTFLRNFCAYDMAVAPADPAPMSFSASGLTPRLC